MDEAAFDQPDADPDADDAEFGEPEFSPPAWDADDPRRQRDGMAPPTEPCECHCIECGRTFSSEHIWFQRVLNDPNGFEGFWMCPTSNCGGAGFTFDIFPTDPDHPANAGWVHDDDEGDGDDDWLPDEEDAEPAEYDPAEPGYAALDELAGAFDDDDDDLEGEEWKHGLQPGERPEPDEVDEETAAAGAAEYQKWRDEQERRFNAPDERPRVIDESARDDRRDGRRGPTEDSFDDEDIPF